MTEHRDRSADRPDPDADTWSAWLPPLDSTTDTTSDATGPAWRDALSDPNGSAAGGPTEMAAPVAPGPPLPQSAGPAVPPAPEPAQRSYPQTATPAAVVEPMPRSHMALAIVSLFLGLPIVSIAAIVAAASVKSRWRKGNVDGAQRSSRAALALSVAALALKFVWTVVQNNLSG